ncbi:hypothetical protein LTS15_004483 [Exophiala xenobiotica]|nr:hypothetical protein LTS15_004483 [Exophiala xenobiotica]
MLDPAEIGRLKQFHTAHFPSQAVPKFSNTSGQQEAAISQPPPQEADDGFGYYEDGVKRTLTDEQIRMFRHSEIQRLVSERRAAKEAEEKQQKRQQADYSRTRLPQKGRGHFDDQPEEKQKIVDTLMYDDQPEHETNAEPTPRTFHWPKLGEA